MLQIIIGIIVAIAIFYFFLYLPFLMASWLIFGKDSAHKKLYHTVISLSVLNDTIFTPVLGIATLACLFYIDNIGTAIFSAILILFIVSLSIKVFSGDAIHNYGKKHDLFNKK